MKFPLFKYCLVFLLLCSYTYGQSEKSALFLGNSYTYVNDLPRMVAEIAISQGNSFRYKSHTPGGYNWSSHATDSTSLAHIAAGDYDYLILQEQSTRLATNENGAAKYQHYSIMGAEYLDFQAKLLDTCVRTMLYLTWGRKEGHGIYQAPFYQGANYNEMQDNLSLNYSQVADVLQAEIAPVGEAWRLINSEHPQIDLYAGDGSHPSLAGTYLAALVFYTAIFQEPVSLPWKPILISDSIAGILKETANRLMTDEWDSWNISTEITNCESFPLSHNSGDWETSEIDIRHSLHEVHFTSSSHAYLKGNGSASWQSNDAGLSWQQLLWPSYNPVSAGASHGSEVFFLNSDTLWYAYADDEIDSTTLVFTGIQGYAGNFKAKLRVYWSADGGQSWADRSPVPEDYQIQDSALLSQRNHFKGIHLNFKNALVGSMLCQYSDTSDTKVYRFTTVDGGLSWQFNSSPVGKLAEDLWFGEDQVVYKSGFKDKYSQAISPQYLYKTEDGGGQWQLMAAFADSCCEHPYSNISHEISAFATFGSDTLILANSLFAPQVYRSVNGGDDWQALAKIGLAGKVEEFEVLADGLILAAVSGRFGRIMASYDYGKTWELEAFFPYSVNGLFANEDYVYAVGTRGTVHRKPTNLFAREISINTGSGFQLYPNPTAGIFRITNAAAEARVVVMAADGRQLANEGTNQQGEVQIDLSSFPRGLYYIRVESSLDQDAQRLLLIP